MNAEQIQKEIRSVDRKIEFEKGKIFRIKQIIDTVKGNIEDFELQKRELKRKLKAAQNASNLPSDCRIYLDGVWSNVLESGFDSREIYILQNMEIGDSELGRRLQITKERVRQIKEKALRKLRHSDRIRPLGEELEDIEYMHSIHDMYNNIAEQDAKERIVLIA